MTSTSSTTRRRLRVRSLGAALLTATSLAALTSCSGSGEVAAPAEQADVSSCDPSGVTLTAEFASQGRQGAELAKEQLEKKYPGLTVELRAAPEGTSYDELTQQVVADIQAGSRPDVIMLGLDQLRFWVDNYSPRPLDTSVLKDSYRKNFLDVGTINGTTYVAPFQISVPVLYTNTTMAGQAGIDELPTTHSQVISNAEKIKEKTGKKPVQIPRDNIAGWFVQAFTQSNGARYVNDDGTAGFDTPQGREALEIYRTIGEKGLQNPVSWQDSIKEFSSGQAAYFFGTPAVAATVKKAVGDSFDWTVSDMPVPDGGTASLPAGGNGWMVLSDDACRAAYSSEMISNMLDPQVIASSARENSYIPVDTAAQDMLRQDADYDSPLGYAWKYEGTPSAGGGWPGQSMGRVNQTLQDMVQQMTDQGRSVDEAVSDAVKKINGVTQQ